MNRNVIPFANQTTVLRLVLKRGGIGCHIRHIINLVRTQKKISNIFKSIKTKLRLYTNSLRSKLEYPAIPIMHYTQIHQDDYAQIPKLSLRQYSTRKRTMKTLYEQTKRSRTNANYKPSTQDE